MNRRGFLARLAAGAAAAVGATATVKALAPTPPSLPFVFTELHSLSPSTYAQWNIPDPDYWRPVMTPAEVDIWKMMQQVQARSGIHDGDYIVYANP